MTPLVWDIQPNGIVRVSADGANYITPILSGHEAANMDFVIRTWEPLIAAECARHTGWHGQTLPTAWGVAHVKCESGGNTNAQNPDGGVGLLQITSPSLKAGHTDQELMADPQLNLRIGLSFLASLWADRGIDLVATTSMWNGGRDVVTHRPHPMTTSPYGFRETIEPPAARNDPTVRITYDHITQIIRANNYYLLQGSGVAGNPGDVANLSRPPAPSSPSSGGDAVAAIALAVLVGVAAS